ncbi:unnamed protein product [Pieris macdunnoughi]|uniref:Uncharacterized protein n=1 Tax=Pieris macdunnoughi TaxID=345717 RepID=A0A821VVW3_9NEOP|nr:unnamed protein product [Pieris macdunnoughi]
MKIIIIFAFLLEVNSIAVRKFVHQKDISEHCRRRVVPSVFLGKHVVDANSEILHFSRLQLPYSCSISVRTEFGNNIILVIQIVSERSIAKSCGPNHNQLHIYELGETFGGYWGAFPDDIFNIKPDNYTKYYTLKTTPKTVETSPVYTEEETEETKQTIYHTQETSTERDFVRVEVPLLNVSGDFGLDEVPNKKQDMEELFDLIYDVAPRYV